MLKGLAITPPVIGRISIGKVVERNGKRLPEKDDEFTITTLAQNRDGWIQHPLNQELRSDNSSKLRSIPVRLMFNDPSLSLRASYSWFDRATGRPLCVGNGETCRRSTISGVQLLPCPTPDGCDASGGQCKPFGRLNVRIGDDDPLGSYIFRTTGYNSIRALSARLAYLDAVSGGLLATLPLELRLRGKSTSQSHRAPIYFCDLTLRTGLTLTDAIATAREMSQQQAAAGIDQSALDKAAHRMLANGAFEESPEEGAEVSDEFFPVDVDETKSATKGNQSVAGLRDKLRQSTGGSQPQM
jgi:hypothetical protein